MADFTCEKCGHFGVVSDNVIGQGFSCPECNGPCFVLPSIQTDNPSRSLSGITPTSRLTLVAITVGFIGLTLIVFCCGILGLLGNVSRPTKSEVRQKRASYESKTSEPMTLVNKDVLKSVFGQPDRVSSIGHRVTWTYRCSDGTIYLRFTEFPYGYGVLVESLDES